MGNKIRVAIWGFGAMGSGMAKMINSKSGFDLVGVCDTNDKFVRKSIFELLGSNNPYDHDVVVESDIVKMMKDKYPEIVLLATDSFTKGAFPKIKLLLEHGANVISTAEEMAYPKANEPKLAKTIDELAKRAGKTVLGTGVNPGMMMDLLAIVMSGVMTEVDGIQISRVNSLSPFGPTVMEEQGVGLSLEEYHNKESKGDISGHVGFRESAMMIAEALGLELASFN